MRLWGVLYFNYHTPGQITEERLRIMQLFANQAAIAIANARLFETLQEVQEQRLAAERWATLGPVSYTHLTLPTILRV